MRVATDNLDLVKGILEPILSSGDIRPLLDRLADDVVIRAGAPEGGPDTYEGTGKSAVLDYFESLGELVTFWRVKYAWSGTQVVVHCEESFTVQPIGLAAHSEFALLFDVEDGLITRLLVVDDPAALAGPSDGWQDGQGEGPGRITALAT
jgi:ketosteroid isomerase-like protein